MNYRNIRIVFGLILITMVVTLSPFNCSDVKAEPTGTIINIVNPVPKQGVDVNATTKVVTVSESGNYRFISGSTIDYRITIGASLEVTLFLEGISISSSTGAPLYINSNTKATLVLLDGTTNTFTSTKSGPNNEGIGVANGATLTINTEGNGTGKLNAKGGNNGSGGAGIGGNGGQTIIINSGIVTATGGSATTTGAQQVAGSGAGIGGNGNVGGSSSSGTTGYGAGTIIINGGTVTAKAGLTTGTASTNGGTGAGIGGGGGGGYNGIPSKRGVGGSGGTVTINGGTITAFGGTASAGIGSSGGGFSDMGQGSILSVSPAAKVIVYGGQGNQWAIQARSGYEFNSGGACFINAKFNSSADYNQFDGSSNIVATAPDGTGIILTPPRGVTNASSGFAFSSVEGVHNLSGYVEGAKKQIVLVAGSNPNLYSDISFTGFEVKFASTLASAPYGVITKISDITGEVKAGDTIVYTLRASNFGNIQWDNAKAADVLPPSLDFLDSYSANEVTVTNAGNALEIDFGSIAAGTTKTVNITFRVTSQLTGASLKNEISYVNPDNGKTVISSDPNPPTIKLTKITVTFEQAGGSTPNPESKEVSIGGEYGLLPVVTKPGYSFMGWWLD